jgi:tRNA pseudouridine38-40 synthase
MRTFKLTLSYDGTRFVGWQRQAQGESIQGLLEAALALIEGAPVSVYGAGRTDAGVHALGQVASVQLTSDHDAPTLGRALNAHLPPEVRVLGIEETHAEFHARFSARLKTYRYLIRNAAIVSPFEHSYVWHIPEPLDMATMHHAAGLLVGTHDFAAFQSTGSNASSTLRTISRSELKEWSEGLIAYEIAGDGFLRHMVRAIVGTLVEIGRGWRSSSNVTELLDCGTRAKAGPTAPPHGLFLVRVDYD